MYEGTVGWLRCFFVAVALGALSLWHSDSVFSECRSSSSEREIMSMLNRQQKSSSKTVQIAGISTHQGRVWVSGRVLAGSVAEGDTLEAVGLAQTICKIDEVRVHEERRTANVGEECKIFLSPQGGSLLPEGTRAYFAMVRPGSSRTGTHLPAKLRWASLRDDQEDGPGFAPAVEPILTDTRVELRFCDITVSATLRKPKRVTPMGGETQNVLVLDQPLPLIADYPFFMEMNGAYAAMGWVVGNDSQDERGVDSSMSNHN